MSEDYKVKISLRGKGRKEKDSSTWSFKSLKEAEEFYEELRSIYEIYDPEAG